MAFLRPYQLRDYACCRQVIESSVRAYCYADHGNDEDTIQKWCEAAYAGLRSLDYGVIAWSLVAGVIGIAACEANKITLNYVAEHYQGNGISGRMLDSIEHYIKLQNYDEILLVSTVAARHMYRKRGYAEIGGPVKGNGVSWNFPMAKRLA